MQNFENVQRFLGESVEYVRMMEKYPSYLLSFEDESVAADFVKEIGDYSKPSMSQNHTDKYSGKIKTMVECRFASAKNDSKTIALLVDGRKVVYDDSVGNKFKPYNIVKTNELPLPYMGTTSDEDIKLFVGDLAEQDRLFHFDDDEIIDLHTGKRMFTDSEESRILAYVEKVSKAGKNEMLFDLAHQHLVGE